MKITPFNKLDDIPEHLFEQSLHGKWYHWDRIYILESDGKFAAVTLNIFERLAQIVLRKDYFKEVFGQKTVKVLSSLKKEIPADSTNPTAISEIALPAINSEASFLKILLSRLNINPQDHDLTIREFILTQLLVKLKNFNQPQPEQLVALILIIPLLHENYDQKKMQLLIKGFLITTLKSV